MVFMAGGTSVHSRKTQVQGVVEGPLGYPQAPLRSRHPAPILLASVPRMTEAMTHDLQQLDWKTLLDQIRWNPDPKVKQEASREAMSRLWNGPDQPEEKINPSVFEPDW
jgi:hypothetical protein